MVDIRDEIATIDVTMESILREAIRRALYEISGSENVMSIINSKQLRTLRERLFGEYKPTIVVWGVASREGGFETNKRIAMARAESARRKLKKKNPNARIITKWAIQGFGSKGDGEKVTTDEQYRQDETNMINAWNKVVEKSKRAKSAREIYARLKKPKTWTNEESTFFNDFFINARKVSLSLEYPKGKQPPTLAMKFEESQDGVKA